MHCVRVRRHPPPLKLVYQSLLNDEHSLLTSKSKPVDHSWSVFNDEHSLLTSKSKPVDHSWSVFNDEHSLLTSKSKPVDHSWSEVEKHNTQFY